ncbi:hypothetical protein [Aquipuribacter sp. SD81]|uniref:hypothetical protein n=1 Tax=Aquipuribacter sp. SD81 TaxID=3127703 RepID=UPI003016A13A
MGRLRDGGAGARAPEGPGAAEVPGPVNRLWLEVAAHGEDPVPDALEGTADGLADAVEGGPFDTLYRFDLTWLTSSWTCVFGTGCRGIDAAAPDAGCCTHGAWFSEAADEERVALAVGRLDATTWANAGHPRHGAGGEWAVADEDGDRRTARVGGACVFHNPRGFTGGYGCALHALALAEGRPHLDTKPDVCWQLPLRRTYAEPSRPDGSTYLEVTVTEYTREGWGAGGADFDWYCTASPAAHVGAEPLWRSLRDELVALVGEPVYAVLAARCEELAPSGPGPVLLPLHVVHPATRVSGGAPGARAAP